MKKSRFFVKQLMKSTLQNIILPCVYLFWRLVYWHKKPSLIIFADAHHDCLPFSLQNLHSALELKGYFITDIFRNYNNCSSLKAAFMAIRFMRLYTQAKYVFICDNFLPVSACRKRKETTVIQVWHSCGLLKKIGYDTADDIPPGYIGSVYRNYDLLTVSAPCCIAPFTQSMRLQEGVVRSLGISRTDSYFNESWKRECTEEFYRAFPQAIGKKIVLWAPTFRGNAGDPLHAGVEQIRQLAQTLGDDYWLIMKVHPYLEAKYHISNCDIQTERLFPVADLLITDYSSTVCEFMMFNKPYVMFAPDLEEFEKDRGFYVSYRALSPWVVTDSALLENTVRLALQSTDNDWIAQQNLYHNRDCDGNATQRLLQHLGL